MHFGTKELMDGVGQHVFEQFSNAVHKERSSIWVSIRIGIDGGADHKKIAAYSVTFSGKQFPHEKWIKKLETSIGRRVGKYRSAHFPHSGKSGNFGRSVRSICHRIK
jgi:hypothetical protein